MQVFINECSLNEQFNEHNFEEAIDSFLQTINSLNQFNDKTVFKSNMFFNYTAIKGTHFQTSLKGNSDLNARFIYNIKNAAKWADTQIHDSRASYTCYGKDFVGTSVAEITERRIDTPLLKAVLINFIDSKFADSKCISVLKNGTIDTKIYCAFNKTSIHEWLIENQFIDPEASYNENLGLPPLDKQTVLCNECFESTQWRNGKYGRKVYRLKETNQLWVVDGSPKHATNKAHIEVFDELTKRHLGTSIYNAIKLDEKYIKLDRKINLF